MSPEEQRIAIAEACGWKFSSGTWWKPDKRYSSGWEGHEELPDYLNDLNAMHEAEKILKRGDESWQVGGYSLYVQALPYGEEVSATAQQRAEAFLKTLNLWKK